MVKPYVLRPAVPAPMIVLHAGEAAGKWFGVACAGEALVATAVSATRARTLAELRRALPPGAEHRIGGDERPEYVVKTIGLLLELEAGEERHEAFTLAPEYVAEPVARVLRVAAAIPLGCVTSYGNIAKAAGTEARDVGGIMASNPLYPIVPCHRVVGADLSLVGYAGSKRPAALQAKLARLAREARGLTAEQDLPVEDGLLRVYPVEWALAKAEKSAAGGNRQRTLFD